MRGSGWLGGCCVVLSGLQVGCAGHSVKYQPVFIRRIPPTEHAVSLSGSFEEAKGYFEKAQLPHNSPREKYELALEGLRALTNQLGSPDYVLIGEVFGGGNAWANQQTLTEALCRKAAQNGGDAVMIFRRGTIERPYVYTTPGYSTTNSNVSAYGYGNYATAYGSSYTTYTPGRTYSGVFHKPTANGLVFKYLPGIDAERHRLLRADDESLENAMAEIEALGNNKKLTWDEAIARWREIVQKADE